MKLTPSSGDFRHHSNSQVYQGWIRSYEVRDGDYGQFILWEIDGPDIHPDTMLMTSASLSKCSKLGRWYKILYPTYQFDAEVDLDTLIGVPIAVMFEHVERDDGGWNEKGKIIAKGDADPKDYPADPDSAPF